ncbi:PAS domain S-box protein [Gracilimonas mengyeensis]|uniref:histidine kinase n=1 Tax=Gracilimonas mengyeensis TaxID=1302730 RepID=A0A521EX01_9BACT|nr:PAS domain S-box protein [Gracilimonas mengyeensis]SMO88419.1 PAS domain S-box-containing protein [Gracilimonas mengyeensis]
MKFKSEESFFDAQAMFVCAQSDLAILDVNTAAEKVFGHPKTHYVGKKLSELGNRISADDSLITNGYASRLSDETIWCFRNNRDEEIYFQLSSQLIHHKGKPAKLVVAHQLMNGNNGKAYPEELLSSKLALNNFPLAEIEWDTNLNVLEWSKKAEEIFGYSAEQAKSEERLLEKFIHPEDLAVVRDSIRNTIANGEQDSSHINRVITGNGEVIYCEWYNSILYDQGGEVTGIYSYAHDVTDRELAFENAKRSTKSYEDLFNSIGDAIYLVDQEGMIVEANEGLEKTFGYTRSEVVGKHTRILADPDKYNENRIYEIIEKANNGQNGKYEGWGRRKNGQVFPTDLIVSSGNYFGKDVLIVIERDVSEQRESQEALKKREGLFSKLFNSLPIGIALLDEQHKVEMVNDGFEHLFGYSEQELKGKELDKVIVPDQKHKDAKKLNESDRIRQVTEKRIRKDGKILDMIIYAIPVVVGKEVVGIYGIYVDITARKKAEDQVRQSLHEKEVLLAEIHHRVKNNLAVITGLLELQAFSVQNKEAKSVLKDSQMRVHSIAMVHEKLYQTEDLSQVRVDKYFEELAATIHKNIKKPEADVKVNLAIDPVKMPITKAIPCGLLLNEILTNSYKHAFKGREKGEIEVSLTSSNNELYFKLRDDGIGLPDQSENGVHSSLGMTVIKTLAKQLNAECKRYSENGTIFEFEFEKRG